MKRPSTIALLGLITCSIASISALGCTDKNKASADKPKTEGPAFVTQQAHAAYVTNNGSDTVSVIDREGTRVESGSCDIDPDLHEAPHHLAIDPKRNRAFVGLAFPPESADPANGAGAPKNSHKSHGRSSKKGKLAVFELGHFSLEKAVDVDENPGDVVLTKDRTKVLVSHYDMKRAMDVAARQGGSPATMFASLMVFRADDLSLIGQRPVCVAPHGIAVTQNGETALVACYGSDEIAVVDLRQDSLPESRTPLGAAQGVPGVPVYGPYSVTLSPDDSRAIVANLEGQDVRIFDVAKKEFVQDAQIPLGARAMMPAYVDAKTILVPTQSPDGLVRLSLDGPKVEKRRAFTKAECGLPHVVRIAKDGRAYVVCEGDHTAPGTVIEFDPVTLETKKSWTVGVYPDGIVFGDD